MTCKVSFFTKDGEVVWKCPNNMGYQTPRKISSTKCWKYNCPGRVDVNPEMFCSNQDCNLLRRPGSKYCDDKCRKRAANKAYKQRKNNAL